MSYLMNKKTRFRLGELEDAVEELAFTHTISADHGSNPDQIVVFSYNASEFLGGTMIVYLRDDATPPNTGVAEYLFVNDLASTPNAEASITKVDKRHVNGTADRGTTDQPLSNNAEAHIVDGVVNLTVEPSNIGALTAGTVLTGVALVTPIPNLWEMGGDPGE